MHKPEGCCYPDCFSCPLPDCEYEEEDLRKDLQAELMRQKRKADPEKYRQYARMQRQRLEQRDPGHYARQKRRWRKKQAQKKEETKNAN